MTAGALKRACHHVCKQPRSAPLNPQTWIYGVSSRMGGERRAGCQERAGAGVAQSGGCHIRGQHMVVLLLVVGAEARRRREGLAVQKRRKGGQNESPYPGAGAMRRSSTLWHSRLSTAHAVVRPGHPPGLDGLKLWRCHFLLSTSHSRAVSKSLERVCDKHCMQAAQERAATPCTTVSYHCQQMDVEEGCRRCHILC